MARAPCVGSKSQTRLSTVGGCGIACALRVRVLRERATVLTPVSTLPMPAHVLPCRSVLTHFVLPQLNNTICGFDSRQLRHEQQCGHSSNYPQTDAPADLTRQGAREMTQTSAVITPRGPDTFAAAFEKPTTLVLRPWGQHRKVRSVSRIGHDHPHIVGCLTLRRRLRAALPSRPVPPSEKET